MKMNFVTKLAVALLALVAVHTVKAETATIDGITWTYTVSNGEVTLGGGSTSKTAIPKTTTGSVQIPKSINGYPVINIGQYAFYNCKSITEVVIPNTIETISSYAFYNCDLLVYIAIPSSVSSIGNNAFYCCRSHIGFSVSSMNTVYAEDGGLLITKDGKKIVNCPSGATSITIPDGIMDIPNGIFSECRSLKTIHIPDTVTNIANQAFLHCVSLQSINIPDSVTSIGNKAFFYCISLKEACILGVENIGGEAFSSCTSLVSVTLSNNITNIGNSAFSGCRSLESMEIPDSVVSIGSSAFSGCTKLCDTTKFSGLESVDGWIVAIANRYEYEYEELLNLDLSTLNIRGIAEGVFSQCLNLESVKLPYGIRHIGNTMFANCYRLKSVCMPFGIESIGYEAFAGCNLLQEIMIPDSVTSIENGAFHGCSSLKNIIIPTNVVRIGARAFEGCESLKDIVIPDSVISIGNYAFSYCTALRSVNIGKGVVDVGLSTFSRCSVLNEISVSNENQKYSSINGLLLSKDGKLLVEGVNGDVVIPECVTCIEHSAFWYRDLLTNVVIPNSVTNIGNTAFRGCSSLPYVIIPDSVINIEDGAFQYCSKLKSVVFMGDAPVVGMNVFTDLPSDCTIYVRKDSTGWGVEIPGTWKNGKNIAYIDDYYTSTSEFEWVATNGYVTITKYIGTNAVVNIPPTIDGMPVTEIGDGAFENCQELQYLTIPDTVTSIGSSAFYRCRSLLNVIIPDGVTNIAAQAFAGCRSLTQISIPDSVATIGSTAFSSCSLVNVKIGSGVEVIGTSAFAYNWGLLSFVVDEDNQIYSSPNGLLVRYGNRLEQGVNGDVVIPDGIRVIGSRAFYNLTNLTSVVIPASVKTISSGFEKCTKLSRIVFLGNAPEVSTALTPTSDCTAYVKRGSTGWGVEIPGTWNGIKIAYLDEGDSGDGSGTNDVVATRCEVTAVEVKPRWPWNGLVDIDYTLQVEPTNEMAVVTVSGCDTVTKQVLTPRTLSGVGAEGEPVTSGTHRITWDIGVDYPDFHSEAFTVDVSAMAVQQDNGQNDQTNGLYMVIDLSGGTNAVSYPVSYLNAEPEGGWTTEHKTTKLVMRRIEPGTFIMGDNDTTNVVQVTLTKPFYMGVFEVTQKQYELVTGTNPSKKYIGDERPVETVSWNVIRGDSDIYNWPSNRTVDVASFMGLIQQKTGLGLDLPTEAQWEYACRAGTTSQYNNGGSTTNDLNVLGRYLKNRNDGKGGYSEHTTVGSYLPNVWGLYDMHGNVYEWCLDWSGSLSNGTDPEGPASGLSRVQRGGGYDNGAYFCRSAYRLNYYSPSYRISSFGFRLCCSAGL